MSSPKPTLPTTAGAAAPAAHADPGQRPVLPGGRAFVVMLRADCDPSRADLQGRVEHVRSGRTAHFTSVDELLHFVATITRTGC